MPTTIRLKRVGRKKQPSYRLVVVDSSRAITGPSIERLGIYNPRTEPSLLRLDAARTLHWLRLGAEPSHTVRSLLRRAGLWEKFHAGVTPEELEDPLLELGPAPGQWKTSRRPKPEARPAGAKRAGAAKATAGAPAGAGAEAAGPEDVVPDLAESEGEDTDEPEGAADEGELRATEAVAAEAATESEAAEAAEEEAPEEAPGGTEATDEIREGAAPEAEAEEAPAGEAEVPAAEAEEGPAAEAEEAEEEEEGAGEDEEAEEK